MHTTERADRLAQLNAELAQARQDRAYYDRVASECRDQADEQNSPQARSAWVNQGVRYRAQAIVAAKRIQELVNEIAALEKPAAPLVLESEWVAGQDDTHNYAGAAA